jgi:hypothetical protein
MNRISQRTPETLKLNFHHISVLEVNAGAKTQAVGSKKMHVHITRAAVSLKLKVMMFKVPQAVAHLRLAGSKSPRPEHTTRPINLYFRRHRRKLRVHNEFRTQRASSEFRARQVQIVRFLESMI